MRPGPCTVVAFLAHAHAQNRVHALASLRLLPQELASMEKEIDLLERVWSLIREWQALYGSWKDGAFVDIEVWMHAINAGV